MNTVPNMISTKDLAYICDMFNWNYNIYKKAIHYLEIVEDEEICKETQKIADSHLEICNSLVQMLKDGKNE